MLVLAGCLVVGAVAEPPRGVPAGAAAFAADVSTGGAAAAAASGAANVAANAAATAGTTHSAALQPEVPGGGAAPTSVPGAGDAALVDATWASTVAGRTGIPVRALIGYAGAALRLQAEQPACHLGWNTLAALGAIESGHGTHAGSTIGEDGRTRPAIYGPDLDGQAYAHIPDSDGGALDGSATGDRAMGPLQFIPTTWQSWGADGNGDGVADPQQLDDAALAAGRYLCSYGDLTTVSGWRASVFAYNHLDSYVDQVAKTANDYSTEAG
ncbi:hypothetical protein B7R21_15445 [Subtercola boreus]|uniref:Transglycosylase SLT domain-containing protein n=2 Tax=Subtercola boreus TaxID=120213 RepID=A0A3E0VCY8_9MICO|nr:hypothetical protein B7R21_15445 [Subtercola boreus]